MTPYFLAIAPVFLLIILGNVLRRNGIPNVEFWNMNDKLAYWVLFPALLFQKTSTINLTPDLMKSYAVIVLGGYAAAVIATLVMSKLAGLPGIVASSVLQGGTRHNTFLALAIAGAFYGDDGVATAALVTAMLVPITNMTIVPLILFQHAEKGEGNMAVKILRDLAKNPFIISIAIGLTINVAGLSPIPVIHDTTALLSTAALPIVLLCIGANLKIRGLRSSTVPIVIAGIAKMIVFPGTILLIATQFPLTDMQLFAALLFGAVPCATAAFTLSRQMGGDHQLMASIITIETLIAFFSLPLTFWLVERFY